MSKNQEQRNCIKFCVSKQIPCVAVLRMLKTAYGDNCLSKSQTYGWYKAFKDGREMIEDLPRSGRPATSNNDENVEKVKLLMLANPRISERDIAAELNISTGSVHNILVQIGHIYGSCGRRKGHSRGGKAALRRGAVQGESKKSAVTEKESSDGNDEFGNIDKNFVDLATAYAEPNTTAKVKPEDTDEDSTDETIKPNNIGEESNAAEEESTSADSRSDASSPDPIACVRKPAIETTELDNSHTKPDTTSSSPAPDDSPSMILRKRRRRKNP